MHTTSPVTKRSETRSITIAASPADVFALVADPHNLPRWAPRFAEAVAPDGEHWRISAGGTEFTVAVLTDAVARTVDIVRPADPGAGAFSRILPNGDGADFLFTLQFGPEADEAAVAAQMAVVEDELRAVRELAEAA